MDQESKQDDLQKLHRETSLQYKTAARISDEALARKTKELATVLKEKKCRDCMICVEELRGDQLVQQLNDRLVQKSSRVNQLEEANRKSTALLAQLSVSTQAYVRSKQVEMRSV